MLRQYVGGGLGRQRLGLADGSPYLSVNRLHHAELCLLNRSLEPLGLAVTGVGGRGMADGTVRVHPNDRLAFLPRIHLSGVMPKAAEARTAGV